MLAEADVGADPLLEGLELREGAKCDADVELVRELRAYACRPPARRAAPDGVALDENDVRHTDLGEMERGACAERTAADDDDLCRFLRHVARNPAVDWGRGGREALERGYTLPAAWYSDPGILRLEQDRIFRRTWQYAGRADQVAEPGDFFTYRAGQIPVVVTRNS